MLPWPGVNVLDYSGVVFVTPQVLLGPDCGLLGALVIRFGSPGGVLGLDLDLLEAPGDGFRSLGASWDWISASCGFVELDFAVSQGLILAHGFSHYSVLENSDFVWPKFGILGLVGLLFASSVLDVALLGTPLLDLGISGLNVSHIS